MSEAAAGSGESFEDFKKSFSYGSRSDLSFKFLKSLSDAEAAEFFRGLLSEIGETYDDGDLGRIHDYVIEWQVRGYTPAPGVARHYLYEDRPFTPMTNPLSQARVGLLTSSGHFAADDDPQPFGIEAMTQDEAERRISEFLRAIPELSSIDRDLPAEDLRVRHGGYDIRSVAKDPNVALPRDRLVEAAAAGRIGEVADRIYSFTGATAQGRLRKEAAPEWVARLRSDAVDAVLLVPV